MKPSPSLRHHHKVREPETDIASPEEGGLIERLKKHLFSSLDQLKHDIESGGERSALLKQARERENHLFSMMSGHLPNGGVLSFPMRNSERERIMPLLEDITHLYSYGVLGDRAQVEHFDRVMLSDTDEPYTLEVNYGKNKKTGKLFILSIELILEVDGTNKNKIIT